MQLGKQEKAPVPVKPNLPKVVPTIEDEDEMDEEEEMEEEEEEEMEEEEDEEI
jgi:hypothetical protein